MVPVAKRELRTIRLPGWRIERLADEILSGPDGRDMSADTVNRACSASVPSPLPDGREHLDDAEFIAYSMQALDPATARRLEDHLRTCDSCSAEIERLRDLAQPWSNEAAMERFENRMRAQLIAGADSPERRRNLGERVSLIPLFQPHSSLGEDYDEETADIEFPVMDDGRPAPGLTCILTRKGRGLHACVEVTDPRKSPQFAGRQVSIALYNPGEASPVWERKLGIGVAVLLGAALRLPEQSEAEARLLPVQDTA